MVITSLGPLCVLCVTVLDLLRPSVVAQCRRRQSGTGLTKRHWPRYGRTIELLPLRSVPTRLSANPVSQSERGLAGGNGQLTPVWGGLFAAMGMAAWPRTIVRRRFCTLSAHSLPKSDGPLRSWQRRPRMRAPVRRRGTCARPSLACEQCLANSTRRRQPHWNRTHSLCTMLSCSRLVWYEFGFACTRPHACRPSIRRAPSAAPAGSARPMRWRMPNRA